MRYTVKQVIDNLQAMKPNSVVLLHNLKTDELHEIAGFTEADNAVHISIGSIEESEESDETGK